VSAPLPEKAKDNDHMPGRMRKPGVSMNPPTTRTVRVAAVQVESKHGRNEINRQHATAFIEQAAQAGAQLIVLPELFASGYMPNETLWDAAELPDGQTITWLKKTSQSWSGPVHASS
jgi:predicted amidohydrolase